MAEEVWPDEVRLVIPPEQAKILDEAVNADWRAQHFAVSAPVPSGRFTAEVLRRAIERIENGHRLTDEAWPGG